MSNGQNTTAAAAAIELASQLAAGQQLNLANIAPVAGAILTAAGKATEISTPEGALALALAQAAIDAHTAITAGQTPAQINDAWAALHNKVTQAQQAWAAASAA